MKQKKKNSSKEIMEMDHVSKKLIIMIGVIVLLFVFMYFLTTKILEKQNIESEKVNKVIQYDEILAGQSFSMKREEYYVLYYDASDEYEDLSSLISTYQSKEDVVKLYYVNLGNGMNKKYITDGDIVVDSASELRVKNATMIHFKSGKVEEVIENKDEIKEYLSK